MTGEPIRSVQLAVELAVSELSGTPLSLASNTVAGERLLTVKSTRKAFMQAVAEYLKADKTHMPIHDAMRWAQDTSDAMAALEESEELFRLWLAATPDVFIRRSRGGPASLVQRPPAERRSQQVRAAVILRPNGAMMPTPV